MLDLSVKQLSSKYKDDIKRFLGMHNRVEHKTDGVKLTLVKVADDGTLDDWIVSYKGSLFYRGEFDYQGVLGKQLSMGNSQFDMVFDHLEKVGKNSILLNTELFIEFLVKKTTVMSNYSHTGQMILIGYGNASPVLRFGKVKTNGTNFKTEGRDELAKQLKINVPYLLHEGAWYPTDALIANCLDDSLRNSFNKFKNELKGLESNHEAYYNKVCEQFLALESKFGGKEEGIIVVNEDGIFKVQQTYQLDKEARHAKKELFIEDDPKREQAYWDDVLQVAEEIAKKVTTQDIKKGLKEISDLVSKLNVYNQHSKKNEFTVRDDIQSKAKHFYLKSLHGNNGALILGKFRVLTLGHVKMIKTAIENSDDVVVGVVTGSRTKATEDIRVRMLRKTFPNIKIIDLVSGNIFTAFKKAEININTIYAGTDRIEGYNKMLRTVPGVKTANIERTNEEISATKVIDKIEDEAYFKANTPKQIHNMYQEILATYKK